MPIIGIPEIGFGSFGLFALIYGAIVVMMRIIMALATNGDAKRLEAGQPGLFLFGPFIWSWLVLIFGLAGLALYWAVHHSSLRAPLPPEDQPAPANPRRNPAGPDGNYAL